MSADRSTDGKVVPRLTDFIRRWAGAGSEPV